MSSFVKSSEATYISSTESLPSVKVPVLSKAMLFALASFSIDVPVFTTIPFRLERLIPATKATGAAKIKGQGEATTNTSAKRTGSFETNQAIPPIIYAMSVKGTA